ncbi:hypothetical protein C2845_PM15G21070 [Panicum miliaceum]|uniref:Inhibitor I9 domain-containing protein n=1 Tax=Panicum miliaceum TaxID=4540 RepID=A0A3L6Q6M2_PANMI|nr:hypothetical protein C2845_PM15G21070 [Panicum miliaceum]
MKTTCVQMVPVLAILAALAVAASAAAIDPPKPRGQQIHLFEATVRVPDRAGDDPEEYNYRLLAEVLGSIEAARSAMYETELGEFCAFLTNNQARRLSKVPGVLKVTRREDCVRLPPDPIGSFPREDAPSASSSSAMVCAGRCATTSAWRRGNSPSRRAVNSRTRAPASRATTQMASTAENPPGPAEAMRRSPPPPRVPRRHPPHRPGHARHRPAPRAVPCRAPRRHHSRAHPPVPLQPAFPAGVEIVRGLPPMLFGALNVAFAGLCGLLGD